MIIIIICGKTQFYFINYQEESFLPDDDPSGGKRILAGGDILVVSESVSMHERIIATVALGVMFKLGDFGDVVCVSRDVVRRRKLTRFKNDWLLRSFDILWKNNDRVWCVKRRREKSYVEWWFTCDERDGSVLSRAGLTWTFQVAVERDFSSAA